MTKSQKITLSASRDIPFNKLLLSQSNVRRIKACISIEELDEDGAETGMFEIPAGGRRYRALELWKRSVGGWRRRSRRTLQIFGQSNESFEPNLLISQSAANGIIGLRCPPPEPALAWAYERPRRS